jgi:AAA15 family ATPase/GTPase
MNSSEQSPPPAYFGSLTIENVKCFKGKHEIDLSDGNGKPAMWTVILGNNNTGKTTLLRCLAGLEAIKNNSNSLTPKSLIRLDPFFSKWSTYCVSSSIFITNNKNLDNWNYKNGICAGASFHKIGGLIIYGYGTNRRMGSVYLSGSEQDNTATLFDENASLTNIEEWLLQIYFAKILGKTNADNATRIYEKIKEILVCGILPNVEGFDFDTTDNFKGFAKFKTDYGWIKLKDLGYGYQTIVTFVVDLAQKLFERYPNSENPLHEPAIVLVDEIDLHLHPEWQRKIIQFLKTQFPKTQFIVTTHSPLIIQSMDDINLVLLEKEDAHVIIKQPDLKTYKGWTVEEILSDLMGLDGRTKSETYYKLIADFNKAALKDDYDTAKKVYDKLDEILNKNNPYRELLDLQLSRLSIPESA